MAENNVNIVTTKLPFYKSKKFWKRTSIIGGIALGIVAVYAVAIEFVLRDYANLTYLQFSYIANPGLTKDQQEVTITRVNPNKNYPAEFVIPSKILGRPVTTIGPEAFAGLSRLRRVEMASSITKIDDRAFYNCPNLSSFQFSSEINYVGVDAFTATPFYESFDDGFLYVGQTLYAYKGLMANGTALVPAGEKDNPEFSAYPNVIEFDDGLSSLSPGLFSSQPGLVSVYLPEGVEVIQREVFANNANLAKVHLPASLLEILDKAFLNTPVLTTINIPESLTVIGQEAFKNSGISGDLVIPNGVSAVGISAFESTPNLTSVSFPADFKTINEYAFRNSTALATTNIDHTSKISTLGREAFAGTAISEFVVPRDVSIILSGVFRNTPNLTTVYLAEPFDRPDSIIDGGVTSLRDYAFFNTPNLKTIATYDPLQTTFTVTSPLNEVNLPTSVKDLGIQRNTGYVFARSGIEKITIPSAVTLFPTNLFEDAKSLATVQFVANSKLAEIKSSAFKGTTALASLTLPDSVITIGGYAFQNSGLTSFVFPSGIITINDSTFENSDSLASVVLPSNLKTIKARSFFDCDSLLSIDIPKSVTHLYDFSFGNCDNLADINFEPGTQLSVWSYAFANSKVLTTAYIPAGVTEVAMGAFKDSPAITSIDWSLAGTVTRINDFAFQNNTSLLNIDIPETIMAIGKDAFTGTAWYEAQPDGYVVLEHILYRYKGALPANGIVTIPSGVKVVNEEAFRDARGQIKQVIFPDSVEVIGNHAFSNANTTLTAAEIAAGLNGVGPETLTFSPTSQLKTIGDNAFLNASAMTTLTLPDSLEVIGSYAFTHMLKLTTLSIGKFSQLKDIRDHAFYDSPLLAGNIYIPFNTKLGDTCFGSISENKQLTINIANPYADSFNRAIYHSNWNPFRITVAWGVAHP